MELALPATEQELMAEALRVVLRRAATLSDADVAGAACVCRAWRAVASDEALWEARCVATWPSCAAVCGANGLAPTLTWRRLYALRAVASRAKHEPALLRRGRGLAAARCVVMVDVVNADACRDLRDRKEYTNTYDPLRLSRPLSAGRALAGGAATLAQLPQLAFALHPAEGAEAALRAIADLGHCTVACVAFLEESDGGAVLQLSTALVALRRRTGLPSIAKAGETAPAEVYLRALLRGGALRDEPAPAAGEAALSPLALRLHALSRPGCVAHVWQLYLRAVEATALARGPPPPQWLAQDGDAYEDGTPTRGGRLQLSLEVALHFSAADARAARPWLREAGITLLLKHMDMHRGALAVEPGAPGVSARETPLGLNEASELELFADALGAMQWVRV